MGKTIIEKIISQHSDSEARPGDIVWLELDVRSARDFAGPNVVKNFAHEYPDEKVNNPEKTLFTFDCVAPAVTIPYATNQQLCRQFARQQGIKVFDVDSGIGSHVMLEHGYVYPGVTVVGTDSHLNIMGAVGAFGQGMGDQDITFAFKTGKTWFEVPDTIKINIKGSYSFPATAKDLTLYVLRVLGTKKALGKALEFYGEQIDSMNLAERLTLASMATEMGAIIAFLPPNEQVLKFCQERTEKKFKPLYADPDAHYSETIEIDISNLEPLLAAPPNPANVVKVKELKGKKVDSVFMGSCTNGRFEDFELAFQLLDNNKLQPQVMTKIVPATKEVFKKLMDSGLLQKFFEAGAIVSHACCAGCASGQIGMTGQGEVQVSTSNRNFPGKQGQGDTYLASPVTAIAAAITGEITDPQHLI